jgi:hypothetical protein
MDSINSAGVIVSQTVIHLDTVKITEFYWSKKIQTRLDLKLKNCS